MNMKKCGECSGTGKRVPPKSGEQDKLSSVCPFCAGTGQALSLDPAAAAKLLIPNKPIA